jgi:hypothetical protein
MVVTPKHPLGKQAVQRLKVRVNIAHHQGSKAQNFLTCGSVLA